MSDKMTGPWRTFHCTEDGAYKFWSVCVKEAEGGAVQHVCWGRIGTSGQEQEKTFDTLVSATEATNKLIASKLGKGYAEMLGEPLPTRKPKPKYVQLGLFDEPVSDEQHGNDLPILEKEKSESAPVLSLF